MQLRAVLGVHDARDSALGVVGVRFAVLFFGDEADGPALGGPKGGPESADPAPYDDEIGIKRHRERFLSPGGRADLSLGGAPLPRKPKVAPRPAPRGLRAHPRGRKT